MEQEGFKSQQNKEKGFKNPEEELEYLREKVAQKEAELGEDAKESEKEQAGAEVIKEYQQKPSSEVLQEEAQMSESEKQAQSLELQPEEHDDKINELLGVMEEKGIHNALSVVDKMQDIHLEDDLHRTLVQWIKTGNPIKGLKEKTSLWRSLRMTLFEVSLPEQSQEEEKSPFENLISLMEQFYAGMTSIATENKNDKKKLGYFVFELAVSENSSEIVFYVAVPDAKKDVFEKQLIAILPDAQIKEQKNDYNIFAKDGVASASRANLKENSTFPLKMYDEFNHDPLNIILNSFSKIAKEQEGAALQIILNPNEDLSDSYKYALNQLQQGVDVKTATEVPLDASGAFRKTTKDVFKEFAKAGKGDQESTEKKEIDEIAIEAAKSKLSAPIMKTNLRIITSAESQERADKILNEIESSFHQFENSQGNKLEFEQLQKNKKSDLIDDFIFRRFNTDCVLPLNTKELTALIHIPFVTSKTSPQFKKLSSKSAAAPLDMSQEGTLLGVNNYRGEETNVYLDKEDRLRHFYTIGQTGTGKTTLLKNMISQDIQKGEGVCMIDPHGADIEDVLANIPKERFEDVIYFEPGYTERVMGLNMLEYNPEYPEQKTFVIDEIFNIFQKLYADVPEGLGPMFQQYFRNAAALVVEDPDSGSTLLDISRVLTETEFREYKLSKSNNPVVNQFWQKIATEAGGESQLANIVPYITSKFDVFTSNEIMRPIIAQQESAFNFRELINSQKILLVNLSKGKLGDINSHLLGLIVVGKILMAALSRSGDSEQYPPFYLYIDEFQNITTDSITTILSEARKYKLSLNIAHQFIGQLEEGIRDAVFGNVGSMAAYRVGSEDADFLAKQFEPQFSAKDLTNIQNYRAVAKILVNGQPSTPFDIQALPFEKGDKSQVEKLKQMSYLKYGRDRQTVEQEIRERYNKVL